MTWYQKVLVSSILAVVAYLCVPVFGDSCYQVVCAHHEYCCGAGKCCYDFQSIWYVWLIMAFVLFVLLPCCCYYCRNRSSDRNIVGQPIVRRQQATAVIISSQQKVQPHPGQYGAFGGAHPQYNWQNQQKYTYPSLMYQTRGYYGGNPEAPPAYSYGPSQNVAPPYQQAPVKTPDAPEWK